MCGIWQRFFCREKSTLVCLRSASFSTLLLCASSKAAVFPYFGMRPVALCLFQGCGASVP